MIVSENFCHVIIKYEENYFCEVKFPLAAELSKSIESLNKNIDLEIERS